MLIEANAVKLLVIYSKSYLPLLLHFEDSKGENPHMQIKHK